MLSFVPLISLSPASLTRALPGFSVYTGKALHLTDEGSWAFELYSNDIVKTTFTPTGYSHNEQISDAVVSKPHSTQNVRVKKSRQRIEFDDLASVTLQDGDYHYDFLHTIGLASAQYFSINEYKGFRFRLEEDEKIFGGGERGLPMNRRGHGFSLYNAPAFSYQEGAETLNFSVPFLISSKGYGLFFDNPSKGYIDAGRKQHNVLEAGFSSGELSFYLINGKSTEEILKRYTTLTGRQPLPPRWVLGNLMSRFGYRSDAQLREVVGKMKEEDFPIDAAILDLFWFGDSIRNTMGNFEFINNEKWPDPKGMVADLQNDGINTVLITEPYFIMGTNNFGESRPHHAVDKDREPYVLTDFYFGFGGLIDIFRKDARDWFWSKYKAKVQDGIAGWWGDLGEPETHPADMYHDLRDMGHKRLFSSSEVHNVFGHYWNKMLFENYRNDFPDTRLFNLNRAGFAGSQRFSVFPWSGDVNRNWSGLRVQLPVMLGMSISGIPYIHADAGGFAGGQKDPELYTRWLQFAAFTPVFRPHGTALEELDRPEAHIESEPVFFPDPFKSIVRNCIRLRYELLPYNYTLSYRQSKEGAASARPMFYSDNSDESLFEANDQYMWGENLLVAPVLHKGATEKKVYLPRGSWYLMGSHAKIRGGQWINQRVTLDQIPVYVKAGSFIPKQFSSRMNLKNYTGAELEITYFPDDKNSSYTLFDDNGTSRTSLEDSAYELIYFSAQIREGRRRITIASNGGHYQGKPSVRVLMMKFPAIRMKPGTVEINGELIEVSYHNPTAIAYWDRKTATLSVKISFSGAETNICY
jgi:oligosaccharide 4-alpha-D-glucosyltransferase